MPTRPGSGLPRAPFRVYEDPDVRTAPSRTGAAIRNIANFPDGLQKGSRSFAGFPKHGTAQVSPGQDNSQTRQPLANLNVNAVVARPVPPKLTGPYPRHPKDAFELPKLPPEFIPADPNKENHTSPSNCKNQPARPSEDEVVKKIHANLVEILPNQNPHHLLFVASRHRNNEYELLKFVEKHLDSVKHAKKRANFHRDEEFNVVAFLAETPDPFAHFLDPHRKCFFNAAGLKFLKNYFNRIKLDKICTAYARATHNMSLAAQSLAGMKENMKTTRPIFDLPTDDVDVRREITFIRHQAEIKSYLDCKRHLEEGKRLKQELSAESTGEAAGPSDVVNPQLQKNKVIAELQNFFLEKHASESDGLILPLFGRNRPHVSFLHVGSTERLSETAARQSLNAAYLVSDSEDESLEVDDRMDILDKLCAVFPTKQRASLRSHCPSRWPHGEAHEVFFGRIVLQVAERDWEEQALSLALDSDVGVGTVGGSSSGSSTSSRESEALRYTDNFSVERFLREIPDPFKYYQDDKRCTFYDIKVLQFLNLVFNRKRLTDIKQAYYLSNYNMSIAAQKLASTPDALQQPRRVQISFDDVDVGLLKEMAFVRHINQIREHMARK